MPSPGKKSQLRLRVFAGPNGSGKSTVIEEVKNIVIDERSIDFGYYINADDIAVALLYDEFTFDEYDIQIERKDIIDFAKTSGLLSEEFSLESFRISLPNVKLPAWFLKYYGEKD